MLLQEITSVAPIELIAGLGYLTGNFLLSKKHISGWIFKIIGGIAWTTFWLQNDNNIIGAVTIVIVLIMFYGFYKWKTGKFDKHTKIDSFFEILATITALIMISKFIFSGVFNLAPIFETIIVIAEIFGTALLARKHVTGWYFYIIMSTLTSVLVIFINPNPAIILGILEILSVYFYYNGIHNFFKKTRSKT